MNVRLLRLGLTGWLLVAAAICATGAGSYYYYLRQSSPTPKRATLVRLESFREAYLPVSATD